MSDLAGTWRYARRSANGFTLNGDVTLRPGGEGLHTVRYARDGRRIVVEFDVLVRLRGDDVIIAGQAPARHVVADPEGRYDADTFTCVRSAASLRCSNQDRKGRDPRSFDLIR